MNTEKVSQFFSAPFEKVLQDLGKNMPLILEAALILVLGLVIALLLRWLSYRVITGLQNRLQKKVQSTQPVFRDKTFPAARITSRIIFWGVLLFFLAAAVHVLDRPVISKWINSLAGYFPNLLAAFLILFLGYLGGNVLGAAVQKILRSSSLGQEELFGKLTKYGVILTAALVAIDQLGININLLIIVMATVVGMFAGGLALAFGLGAQPAVKNILANHYIGKHYQVGQHIQIEEIQGKIVRIESTYLNLETTKGPMTIPAAWFLEKPVQLLQNEET